MVARNPQFLVTRRLIFGEEEFNDLGRKYLIEMYIMYWLRK